MKKLSDEDIQKMLEQGNYLPGSENDPDFRLYAQLFQGLQEGPANTLPAGFSARIATAAYRRMSIRRQLMHTATLLALAGISLGLGLLSIAYVNTAFFTELTQLLWQQKWIIVFALVCFCMVQLGDVFLRKRLQLPASVL